MLDVHYEFQSCSNMIQLGAGIEDLAWSECNVFSLKS